MKRLNLGFYETIKWLELWFIVVYTLCVFKKSRQFQTALFILFISGIFQAILGIAQFHVQHQLNLSFLGEYIPVLGTPGLSSLTINGTKIIRAYGTFPHPNVFAGFLVSSIISGFFLVSRATKRYQWLIGLGLVILVFGLFFTFSRIAWLAVFAGSLVFLGIYYKKRAYFSFFIIIASLVVSCATLGVVYQNFIQNRVSDVAGSDAVTKRGVFDQFGLEIIKQYPVLGTGVGNYIPVLEKTYLLEPWQYQPPHNIFIFIGAELGVLGLGLFILILIEIFSSIWRFRNHLLTTTLFTIGFVYILIGCFDHYFVTIQQGRLIFFTVLGLTAALINLKDHENKIVD